MRARLATGPDTATTDGSAGMIRAETTPARRDARTYFQTAAITGAYVAFAIACKRLMKERRITKSPVISEVAAVSVGIVDGTPLLDLKYDEDSRAQVDMNIVCTGDARFIEVQGTAEGSPFRREEMDNLLELGRMGIEQLVRLQRQAIEQAQI